MVNVLFIWCLVEKQNCQSLSFGFRIQKRHSIYRHFQGLSKHRVANLSLTNIALIMSLVLTA